MRRFAFSPSSSRLLLAALALLCLLSFTLTSAAPSSTPSSSYQTKLAKYNARVGAKFLSKKAEEPDVVRLESGVLYKVLSDKRKKGGRTPGPLDRVSVHYRGTLINGDEFDSSIARGQPAEFGVMQVIKGWTEVLQLMHEGEKWEVYIPGDRAYGESGAGGKIGPNATLVFTIELLEITGPATKRSSRSEEL